MRKGFFAAWILIFGLGIYASADSLGRVCDALNSEKRAGRCPVVVFNIDGTIFDNRPRSQAILRDFIRENPEETADIADSIIGLQKDSMEYYVVDSFKKAGVENLFIVEAALRFWADRFFSDAYVNKDLPFDGAVDFINELHDSGALIVYFSGRDQGTMLSGTIRALRDAGFPVGTARTMTVFKANPEEPSQDYKRRVMGEITTIGRVIAAFDNDPRTVNTMRRQWPTARIFFVKSQSEPQSTVLESEIEVIESYQE